MSDPRLFLDSGYINLPFMLSFGCTLNVLIGPRGTGKTYTILDYYLKKNEPIIYMRRSNAQLENCCSLEGNPYKEINYDNNLQSSLNQLRI